MRTVLVATVVGVSLAATAPGQLSDTSLPVPTEIEIARLEARLASPTEGSAGTYPNVTGAISSQGSSLGMPIKAEDLDQYDRHYSYGTFDPYVASRFTTVFDDFSDTTKVFGEPGIIGVFVANPDGDIYRSPSFELPYIFHGGCSVINVVYSLDMDRITGIWCNWSYDY